VRGASTSFEHSLVQYADDARQYIIGLRKCFIVPEAEQTIAESFQKARSGVVVQHSLCVLTAVDLDDQFGFITNEVDYEDPNLMLSAKLVALKPAVMQTLPEA